MNVLMKSIGIRKLPGTCYIIFSTPRSGSTYFCEALKKTKRAGNPDEHFLGWYRSECRPEQLHPMEAPFKMLPPALQMQKVIQAGMRKGVFGVKVMFPYYSFVENSIRQLSDQNTVPARLLLENFFPNLHYIHLSRRNKIRQAVSLARALQLGEWKKNLWTPLTQLFLNAQSGTRKKTSELLYDFDKILGFYKEMARQDLEWERYFSDSQIQPLRIIYEDLMQDFEACMNGALDYLGLPLPAKADPVKPVLQRQSDEVNDEWTQRFQRDLARLESASSDK